MAITSTDYIVYSEALSTATYSPSTLSLDELNSINNTASNSAIDVGNPGNNNIGLKFITSNLGIPSTAKIIGFTIKVRYETFSSPLLNFAFNFNTRELSSNQLIFANVNFIEAVGHPSETSYDDIETGYGINSANYINDPDDQTTPLNELIQTDQLALRIISLFGEGSILFDADSSPAIKIHYKTGTKTTILNNTKVKIQNQNKIKLI